MSKESLTPDQLNEAQVLDKMLKEMLDINSILNRYRLGDVYLFESWDDLNPNITSLEKTGMGFPVKYKVVHISEIGIPYLRRLSSSGNPIGEAIIPPEARAINAIRFLSKKNYSPYNRQTMRFIPDPEQLDAILLQQEFDPMAQHAEKARLFNQINKHNKEAQISTGWSNFKDIADFFKSLKNGDKFWTSPEKQFILQSCVKQGREYVITATDCNNATVTFNFSYFSGKRLYRKQPRSFSKESKI